MENFWRYYKDLVSQLYEPLSPEDGFSEDELEGAEKRLGLRLPGLLREYYLLAGKREDINQAHNKLVHPDELQIEDGKLVFFLENQVVNIWGIEASDINLDNPPVTRGDSMEVIEEIVWEPDFEQLSFFLLAMLCWQGVMGGMECRATVSGIDAQVERVAREKWRAIDLGKNRSGIRPYIGDGQLLCLAGIDPDVQLFAGARTEDKFTEIEDLLNVDWDYCSLDDE